MKTRFTILIAEDDDSFLTAIKHLLEYEGFLVFGAENAIEALEKIKILVRAGELDLILTDIQMPFDGTKLIDALQTKIELGEIPIISMSAGGVSHISGKKVIPKPPDLHKLIDTIRKTIREDRATRHKDDE